MKKILVTTAICLIGAASMMAQGRINFAPTSTTPIRINNGTSETPGGITQVLGTASTATFGIGPGSVRIQLFAGLSSASLSPVLIGTGANQNFVTNNAGTIASAQGTFAGGNPLPLPGYDGSQPVFLRFTATSINGIYVGTSTIISVNPTLSPAAAATVFNSVASPSAWNGITLYAVPEPTSMALAGLGAASLLIFRRRK